MMSWSKMSSSFAILCTLALTINLTYGKLDLESTFSTIVQDNPIFNTLPSCKVTAEEHAETKVCLKLLERDGASWELLCGNWNGVKDCYIEVLSKYMSHCWPNMQEHYKVRYGLTEVWDHLERYINEYSDLIQKLMCKNNGKIGEVVTESFEDLVTCVQETTQAVSKNTTPPWTNEISMCLMSTDLILEYMQHQSICKTVEKMSPTQLPECLGNKIKICENKKLTKMLKTVFKQKEGRDILKRVICLYELLNSTQMNMFTKSDSGYSYAKTEL